MALGGTAVGTGVNTHPEFSQRTCARLAEMTGVAIRETGNHFQAQSALDGIVEASGQLKTVAISLHKIANDIRFLGCGPRAGLGEINVPEVQPGSSIMPGKVNPVISESVIQVAAHVVGNDAAVALAGAGGYFELNTMMPSGGLQPPAVGVVAGRLGGQFRRPVRGRDHRDGYGSCHGGKGPDAGHGVGSVHWL